MNRWKGAKKTHIHRYELPKGTVKYLPDRFADSFREFVLGNLQPHNLHAPREEYPSTGLGMNICGIYGRR